MLVLAMEFSRINSERLTRPQARSGRSLKTE